MPATSCSQDVNSYAKAFGELVEHRKHTPSLPADDVARLISSGANIAILDVRRFDEYATMNIPGSVSVPGAELVLRAGRAAPIRTPPSGELRRPHPLDHRHAVADQCRRAEQGGGAAQRHRSAGLWRNTRSSTARTARRDRRLSMGGQCAATSPIAPASAASVRRKQACSQGAD